MRFRPRSLLPRLCVVNTRKTLISKGFEPLKKLQIVLKLPFYQFKNVQVALHPNGLEAIVEELEVVDVRSAAPLDRETLCRSIDKTHHCVVADYDWAFCGFGAELAATVSRTCFDTLHRPVERIGFAHTPCPTARSLEERFYPSAETLVRTVEKILGLSETDLSGEELYTHENRFKGPF